MLQRNYLYIYLCILSGLAGEGELNQARVEMLIDASEDIRQKFAKVCYSPDFEKLRGPYVAETMPVEFGKIENILKSNDTGFLVGSSVRPPTSSSSLLLLLFTLLSWPPSLGILVSPRSHHQPPPSLLPARVVAAGGCYTS